MLTPNPFDVAAQQWDTKPERVIMAEAMVNAIVSQEVIPSFATILDFGCGTGLIGLNIASSARKLIGVDSSPKMLDCFVEKSAILTCDVETHLADELQVGVFKNIDLIVSAMTCHHIRELSSLFHQFYHALSENGMLVISDLDQEDGTFHSDMTQVFHQGFSKETMTRYFHEAGFHLIHTTCVYTIHKNERDYPVMLYIGKKVS